MIRFAIVLALSAFVSEIARADELDNQAIALVEKLGGTASVKKELDEGARVVAKFEKASDKILQSLAKMPVIGEIEILDGTGLTDAGFGTLRELPNLQILTLNKCPVNEKDTAALGTIRPLTELFIGGSKLTDASFAGLKKLVNLKKLDVMDAGITDKSAAVLKGFKKLEELNLSGTKFGDDGVVELKTLEKLKLLRLNRTNVTRKGIDAIEAARGKDLTVRW